MILCPETGLLCRAVRGRRGKWQWTLLGPAPGFRSSEAPAARTPESPGGGGRFVVPDVPGRWGPGPVTAPAKLCEQLFSELEKCQQRPRPDTG